MSIRLAGVGAAHPGAGQVLKGLELGIETGERVAVIGPSGAGKTSLLRLLGMSLVPASGSLQILGSNPAELSARATRRLRSRIGLIHQSPPLPARQRVITAVSAGRLGQWSTLRALASLCYPLDISGVRSILSRLDLEDKLFERCDQLSGGQLQRVGIARVLYQQAELILADEPVSAMDPLLADHTLALLNRLAEEDGTTLVASLHAVDLALRHFPRVIGLRDGEVLFDRPASQVSDADLQALYANASLTAEPLPKAGVAPAVQPPKLPIRPIAPRCL
ncbi:ATP-binding cassette domain-containing protein [Halopseudomonas nanhaiensis]|uniref:phosphonate ABC transporter ATP-binding protein n=1 Tax=Halopseudomonas nanhaiensis TaxID=2830842 RepID=UPI001CBDB0DE|nr:ATP-binding cassette domain-containing protein [Halopseudomonas nanhaiensis]UAW99231.1 ATP-binding cassette domain-containing protein [Halopseudomonas nanhaiensis]